MARLLSETVLGGKAVVQAVQLPLACLDSLSEPFSIWVSINPRAQPRELDHATDTASAVTETSTGNIRLFSR
ncbi:MAG: hypothetical protein ACLU8W_13220 [Clostridia bacterium]